MADFAEALEKLTDVLAPSGLMLPFAGKSIPDGWLLCNGAAVSRTTYADLFVAIGTAWGTGDGSTTFNLPNCDSRFMEGTTDASKVGTYLEAGLPNITGKSAWSCGSTAEATVYSGALSSGFSGYIKIPVSGTVSGKGDVSLVFDAKESNSLYSSSNSVQPSAIQTLIIIKV